MQCQAVIHCLLFTLVHAGPFTFNGPSGEPPWATASAPAVKRARVSPQPGSPQARESPTAIPTQTSAAPSAGSAAVDVIDRANAQHAAFMELLGDVRGHSSVHAQLAAPWQQINSRVRAPPPRAVLQVLLENLAQGMDIGQILDSVASSRVAHSIRDSSLASYSSHLKSVCSVCSLLDASVVPATLRTVRRYSAICNNPVTLRGHLAAWRLLHLAFGHEWSGDRDPFLKAVQAGLLRLIPAPRPKMAIQLDLTCRIVAHCFCSGDTSLAIFGMLCALAYLFALRVPSELLRQGSLNIISLSGDCIRYGPISRKGSSTQSVLRRRCLCQSSFQSLCAHAWRPHLLRLTSHAREGFQLFTPQSFNTTLRAVLRQLHVPPSVAELHASHDFRRGCAKDVLRCDGPAAMMSHCGWKHKSSAMHYVSQDEVDEAVLANIMADISDDE
jgi:hypothetical protein